VSSDEGPKAQTIWQTTPPAHTQSLMGCSKYQLHHQTP
jgi:hypothetical protein